MDSQPSSGRPTGPPSGPLSGPSSGPQDADPSAPSGGPAVPPPPPGPPGPPGDDGGHGGGGGGGGDSGGTGGGRWHGGPGEGPRAPWWRSAPRIALIAGAVVAALALVLVFTRSDGGSESGEVFLQAASSDGPDPFTSSTADDSTPTGSPTGVPSTQPSEPSDTRSVEGSAAGLYGGSQDNSSCDVERQIDFLSADTAKSRAWAGVAGIQRSEIPRYLRSLTPVQLRMDTRVTNHGFKDDKATSYQAVLQTGTAVLVDSRGVPRVRCACGNPLLPPVAVKGTPEETGDDWPSFRRSNVVVVAPSMQVINNFVLFDLENGTWFSRPSGDTGDTDRQVPPPAGKPTPTPSESPSGSPDESVPPDSESPPAEPPTPESPPSEAPPTQEPPGEPSAPPAPPDNSPDVSLTDAPLSEPVSARLSPAAR